MTRLEVTGPYKIGDQILGDLEVTGLLGMGGHAYVYECVDRYMDATIAVKVIPNVPGRGKGLLSRAQAEAKLLFKLNHPNVVRVMTARPVGDQMVCIVMEKLEGLSLRQFLRLHKRFTVTEALLIVRQIAAGVSAAHRLNVIHRDIKPENVFILPPDNQVKVLDFGIAKFLGQGLDTTNKLRVHGTPLYMSPEHLQSSNITFRSDIYELGGVAFELMTGKIPCLVDLENPNFQQMAYVQIMKPTPPVSRLVKDVGPRTEMLIKRATAKDPAQRFASMQEVIAAIDEALIEQKTLFPHEAETIRYLDDTMIQAVKLAERRTDEEDEGWEPIHDSASLPPKKTAGNATLALAKPTQAQSKPPVTVAAQQRAPVMAPTVELNGEMEQEPHQADTPVMSTSVSATSPAMLEPESVRPSSSASSLNVYATTDTLTQESTPRTAWFQVPLPVVLLTIFVGLGIATAISWPDIQRARTRKHAQPAAQVVSTPTPPAPKPMESSATHSVSRAASPVVPSNPVVSLKPEPSAAPVSTLAAAPTPKLPSAKPARKSTEPTLIFDREVPTVTKAELDRMRAREKAFAADMDREAAEAKKAKNGAAP